MPEFALAPSRAVALPVRLARSRDPPPLPHAAEMRPAMPTTAPMMPATQLALSRPATRAAMAIATRATPEPTSTTVRADPLIGPIFAHATDTRGHFGTNHGTTPGRGEGRCLTEPRKVPTHQRHRGPEREVRANRYSLTGPNGGPGSATWHTGPSRISMWGVST